MENTPVQRGIKASYSLINFARMKGKMQIGSFESNGKNFTSCIFTDVDNPDSKSNKTFVAFSSNLGVLTPAEIIARKNDLQVVELNPAPGKEKGSFILCVVGDTGWQDVDLGL